jgi:hypothetical protein
MEAIRSSEMSVLIRATWCHFPEDDNHPVVIILHIYVFLQVKYTSSEKNVNVDQSHRQQQAAETNCKN